MIVEEIQKFPAVVLRRPQRASLMVEPTTRRNREDSAMLDPESVCWWSYKRRHQLEAEHFFGGFGLPKTSWPYGLIPPQACMVASLQGSFKSNPRNAKSNPNHNPKHF